MPHIKKIHRTISNRKAGGLLEWWKGLSPEEKKREKKNQRTRYWTSKPVPEEVKKRRLEKAAERGRKRRQTPGGGKSTAKAVEKYMGTTRGQLITTRYRKSPSGRQSNLESTKKYVKTGRGKKLKIKSDKRYASSPKGKKTSSVYRKSEHGKKVRLAIQVRYAARPKGQKTIAAYLASEWGHEVRRRIQERYAKSPKGIITAIKSEARRKKKLLLTFKMRAEQLFATKLRPVEPIALRLDVEKALTGLSKNERRVMENLFGINPEAETVEELGRIMNRTVPQIENIAGRALKKLEKNPILKKYLPNQKVQPKS